MLPLMSEFLPRTFVTMALALLAGLLMPAGAAAQTEPAANSDAGTAAEAPRGVLVVANGASIPDIAVASSMVAAGAGDAVVLAESADTLGVATAQTVRAARPARAVLIGGAAALSAALETELGELVDDLRIERIAGADRMHTAALAAESVLEGAEEATVVLANAWSLPDVLAAAAAVTAGRADVLLYAADGWLGYRAAHVLRMHRPERLVVAGGQSAFSHEMAVAALTAADRTVVRRLDSMSLAQNVARAATQAYPDDIAIAVVAADESLNDVGKAVALAASLDRSPVLLTDDGSFPDDAEELLVEHQPSHIVIVDTAGQHTDERLRPALEELVPAADISSVTSAETTASVAITGIDVAHRPAVLGFTSVSAGHSHVCGLREDGTVVCSGGDTDATLTAPGGTYVAVATGGVFACALRTDGSPRCWGGDRDLQNPVPDGPFANIVAGWGHACARTFSNDAACWGDRWGADYLLPTGAPFRAISAGRHHTCGLEVNYTVECWGQARHGQLNVPDGEFVAVAAGDTHSCALSFRGAIRCWGEDGAVSDAHAAKRYLAVDAGGSATCGLLPSLGIDCWGHEAIADVPPGQFVEMSVGGTLACALRTNTSVVCWGGPSGAAWEPFGGIARDPAD